jgi:ADP-ribose pyrophosphatase YjhB (NUDIX family)
MTTVDSDDELLVLVDDAGAVLGADRRDAVHDARMRRHQAISIVIETPQGRLYQRRDPRKRAYPGFWDTSVSGHVAVGETYEEAARRELREELGVAELELELVATVNVDFADERERAALFVGRSDGPFALILGEIVALGVFPDGERPAPMGPGTHTVLDVVDAALASRQARRGTGTIRQASTARSAPATTTASTR